jgi:hypothetical protein
MKKVRGTYGRSAGVVSAGGVVFGAFDQAGGGRPPSP